MGGLVSRGFIQRHQKSRNVDDIPLYVTISTPWGGHKAAEAGVKKAPVVVEVWRDMVPDRPYQQDVFATPLPPTRQLAQVAVADIGAVAIRLLENPGRFAGKRSPAKSTDPMGPLTADQTMVVNQIWASNHGKQSPQMEGDFNGGAPDGHNESFSDGHAEWFGAKHFPFANPYQPAPQPLWNSNWPWSWTWVEL